MRAGRFQWSVLLITARRSVRGPRRALLARRCASAGSAAVHVSDGERCIHPDWSSDAHRSGLPRSSILIVAFAKEEYERGSLWSRPPWTGAGFASGPS